MENTKKVAANAATAFIANGDLRLSPDFVIVSPKNLRQIV